MIVIGGVVLTLIVTDCDCAVSLEFGVAGPLSKVVVNKVLLAAAGSVMLGLSAISADAETILGAMGSAYSSNPTLNAQRAATRVADENLPLAKSGYRPTINASADYGISRSVTSIPGIGSSTSVLHPGGFGVTISQSLFRGFRTQNSVKAAEAGIRASRETLRNTEQNILFDAASAFVDVIRDRQLTVIRKKNLSFLNEQSRAARARLDVGEGTRTDVAQANARRSLAQAQLSAANAQLTSSSAIYRRVVGHAPGKLKMPAPISHMLPRNLNDAFAIAFSEHPALKATQLLVDVAEFNVKVSEGALLPTLSLEGSASKRFSPSSSIDHSTSASITARLVIPIYQGGSATATIRKDKETLGQRRIEVDASRDQIRTAVVSSWTQVLSAKASSLANVQQERASKLALSGVIEERKVGQRTTLDVLNAQSDVLSAKELLVNSRRNEMVAGYAVMSAIGRLNSKRFSLNVAQYEPKEHYHAVKDKWYGWRTPDGR